MKRFVDYIKESLLDPEEEIINNKSTEESLILGMLFKNLYNIIKKDPFRSNDESKEAFKKFKYFIREHSSLYNKKTPKEGELYVNSYWGYCYETSDICLWSKPECLKYYDNLSRTISVDQLLRKHSLNCIQFKNFIQESWYPRPDKSAEYEVRVIDKHIAKKLIELINSYDYVK